MLGLDIVHARRNMNPYSANAATGVAAQHTPPPPALQGLPRNPALGQRLPDGQARAAGPQPGTTTAGIQSGSAGRNESAAATGRAAPAPRARRDQRLLNCLRRRAPCRPTFLRSTSRASRVTKPARDSSGLSAVS